MQVFLLTYCHGLDETTKEKTRTMLHWIESEILQHSHLPAIPSEYGFLEQAMEQLQLQLSVCAYYVCVCVMHSCLLVGIHNKVFQSIIHVSY